jgi:hypothetical protein
MALGLAAVFSFLPLTACGLLSEPQPRRREQTAKTIVPRVTNIKNLNHGLFL